ncbi:hypothetical protein E4T66_14015 [Sinimarinibacterium sp. CAU 1509]|nr:hypothetical protein E4T66_14015 [Sinimarinibacterium sp. CAU 1509]
MRLQRTDGDSSLGYGRFTECDSKRWTRVFLLCAVIGLAACEDDTQRGKVSGLPVYCDPLGDASAQIAISCFGCKIDNVEAAADGDFHSAATVTVLASPDEGGATIRSSTVFFYGGGPGSKPGAFIRLPQDPSGIVSWTTVRIRTYSSFALVGDERAQIGSALGLIEGDLKRADMPPSDDSSLPQTYVYFEATQPFDNVEIEFAAPGLRTDPAVVEVFALCENGGLL